MLADGTTRPERSAACESKPTEGRRRGERNVQERLTFIVSEPNAKTPPGYEAVAEAAVEHPRWTIGAAAARDVHNFYVVAANPAAKTISMVDPNGGEVHTFSLTDAVAQAQLPRIKPGYKLTVIDLQAVIGVIEKKV
jgi:hypothetical protein